MSSDEKGLIVVKNLSKSYEIYERPTDKLKQILFGGERRCYFREFHALSDVTFEVLRGSSLGVIGKNGAGKSTLLQLITGTLEPTSGTVDVSGKIAAVLELGAGFNMEFSGRENIELYCNLFQMIPASFRERFDQIVAFSELERFIDQPLKTYSSGMVARLAFSVIAHVDADILIIDEALSVGDAAFSQKCMRFLNDFRKRGTIFFVSHDLGAIKAFCDSAIWLDGGKVRLIGSTRVVCEGYLAEVYPNNDPVKPNNTGEKTSVNVLPEIVVSSTVAVPKELDKISAELPSGVSPKHGFQNIEAFSFNLESTKFGNNIAKIVSVSFTDSTGKALAFCEGQLSVLVCVRVIAHEKIASPIIGFFVKDRLGQPLFGANTYLTYEVTPVSAEPGQEIEATFSFFLPTLMVGDYSITAAVADGTLQSHTQLHWMHDAILFKVMGSTLDGVLVGIPMQDIELKVLDNTKN